MEPLNSEQEAFLHSAYKYGTEKERDVVKSYLQSRVKAEKTGKDIQSFVSMLSDLERVTVSNPLLEKNDLTDKDDGLLTKSQRDAVARVSLFGYPEEQELARKFISQKESHLSDKSKKNPSIRDFSGAIDAMRKTRNKPLIQTENVGPLDEEMIYGVKVDAFRSSFVKLLNAPLEKVSLDPTVALLRKAGALDDDGKDYLSFSEVGSELFRKYDATGTAGVAASFTIGTALDIALDPVTWMTFGVGNLAKYGTSALSKTGMAARRQYITSAIDAVQKTASIGGGSVSDDSIKVLAGVMKDRFTGTVLKSEVVNIASKIADDILKTRIAHTTETGGALLQRQALTDSVSNIIVGPNSSKIGEVIGTKMFTFEDALMPLAMADKRNMKVGMYFMGKEVPFTRTVFENVDKLSGALPKSEALKSAFSYDSSSAAINRARLVMSNMVDYVDRNTKELAKAVSESFKREKYLDSEVDEIIRYSENFSAIERDAAARNVPVSDLIPTKYYPYVKAINEVGEMKLALLREIGASPVELGLRARKRLDKLSSAVDRLIMRKDATLSMIERKYEERAVDVLGKNIRKVEGVKSKFNNQIAMVESERLSIIHDFVKDVGRNLKKKGNVREFLNSSLQEDSRFISYLKKSIDSISSEISKAEKHLDTIVGKRSSLKAKMAGLASAKESARILDPSDLMLVEKRFNETFSGLVKQLHSTNENYGKIVVSIDEFNRFHDVLQDMVREGLMDRKQTTVLEIARNRKSVGAMTQIASDLRKKSLMIERKLNSIISEEGVVGDVKTILQGKLKQLKSKERVLRSHDVLLGAIENDRVRKVAELQGRLRGFQEKLYQERLRVKPNQFGGAVAERNAAVARQLKSRAKRVTSKVSALAETVSEKGRAADIAVGRKIETGIERLGEVRARRDIKAEKALGNATDRILAAEQAEINQIIAVENMPDYVINKLTNEGEDFFKRIQFLESGEVIPSLGVERGMFDPKTGVPYRKSPYVYYPGQGFVKEGKALEDAAVEHFGVLYKDHPWLTNALDISGIQKAPAKEIGKYYDLDPIAVLNTQIADTKRAVSKTTFYKNIADNLGIAAADPEEAQKLIDYGMKTLRQIEASGQGERLLRQFPFLENVYFSDENLHRIVKAMRDYRDIEKSGLLLSTYDKLMNLWRAGVTVVWPAHISKNAVGNVWNNGLSGLWSPVPYMKAFRMQMDHVIDVARKKFGFVDYALSAYDSSKVMNAVAATDDLGFSYSYKDIFDEAVDRSIVSKDAIRLDISEREFKFMQQMSEFSAGNPKSWAMILPGTYGVATRGGRSLNSFIETNARLAHFIDKLAKGYGPDAAERSVKQYLFDYNAVTGFEKKYMRRIFGFYTWTRKNIPLQTAEFLRNPGRFVNAHRIHKNYSRTVGVSEEDDFFVPDYLQDSLLVGVPMDEQKRVIRYYNLIGLPIEDLYKIHPRNLDNTIFENLTPPLKAMFEIIQGRSATGGPWYQHGIVDKARMPSMIAKALPEPIADFLRMEKEVRVNPLTRELEERYRVHPAALVFLYSTPMSRVSSILNMRDDEAKDTYDILMKYILGVSSYDIDMPSQRNYFFKLFRKNTSEMIKERVSRNVFSGTEEEIEEIRERAFEEARSNR